MNKIRIQFKVNAQQYDLKTEPLRTLAQILRDDLHLTGTKIGCDKGECGACTVILNNRTVDSCLVPACQLNHTEIITIEGIGDEKHLHPIQQAYINEGAVQCGFCIPGFIISTYQLVKDNNNPDDNQIKEAVAGNLCRCTGYAKILKAIKKSIIKK